jgi:hypothetical protein
MKKTTFIDVETIGLEIKTISTLTGIAVDLIPGQKYLKHDTPASMLEGSISKLGALLHVILGLAHTLAKKAMETSEAMRAERLPEEKL